MCIYLKLLSITKHVFVDHFKTLEVLQKIVEVGFKVITEVNYLDAKKLNISYLGQYRYVNDTIV